MKRTRWGALALALAVGLIAACGDTETNPSPGSTTGTEDASTQDATSGTDAVDGTDVAEDVLESDSVADIETDGGDTADTEESDSGDVTGDTTGGDIIEPECKSSADCNDNDPCTDDLCLQNQCSNPDNGSCGSVGAPDACIIKLTPGTTDAAIESCVCGQDTYCCQTAWDDICVGIAETCGAPCNCAVQPVGSIKCVTAFDCEYCNDPQDLCGGSWECVEGTCVNGGPVQCDPALTVGCQINQCDPFIGSCVVIPDLASCDDGDACTADTCGTDGQCVNTELPGCGANNPCEVAVTPGSNNDEITACVCSLDSYCCTNQWDSLCVSQAQGDCGFNCNCSENPPENLACEQDADCSWCNDPSNLCNGTWSCVDGTCADNGAVECDTSEDFGCVKTTCNPLTGLCAQNPDNVGCADEDVCTADSCDVESGDCINEPQEGCGLNHPCETAPTPGSKDEAVNTCLCEIFPECCTNTWEDFCVFLAQDFCGVSCDCNTFPVEDLECESNADCAFCDLDFSSCNGTWICEDNQCVALGALPNDCDDNNPCTTNDCDLDALECVNTPIEGCGENHPCEAASTPGTNDPDVQSCVCQLDPFCCEFGWESYCVFLAQDSCGLQCDCSQASPEDLACETDSDCGYCDQDGTVCNGGWACTDGTCTATEPIVCEEWGGEGCLTYKCISELNACDFAPVPAMCDDGDHCTIDTCDVELGECTWSEAPLDCGLTDPCVPSEGAASNNPVVNDCVCAVFPECCTGSWSDECVQIALFECGLDCGCKQMPPSCEEDTDCASCDIDPDSPCGGEWFCNSDGVCEGLEAVQCEADGEGGCLVPGCVPETGECDYLFKDGACNDNDPCTADSCNQDGFCQYENLTPCFGGGGPGEPIPLPVPEPEPFP